MGLQNLVCINCSFVFLETVGKLQVFGIWVKRSWLITLLVA
ncbi:LOW QUALITY PROTEIN: hypothetical protein PanWU01x14_112490 [Parasponia andersonii]|uniref:Uncharacterized protein n=1 Tax=Parasponia andersonii TaxID=3476 RepID=A0A2P5CY93_PARAD|nr:LOW QUALITY PROTEIN: hypothetical protein PanWU01x14_112490 [Parasponia andersonii]